MAQTEEDKKQQNGTQSAPSATATPTATATEPAKTEGVAYPNTIGLANEAVPNTYMRSVLSDKMQAPSIAKTIESETGFRQQPQQTETYEYDPDEETGYWKNKWKLYNDLTQKQIEKQDREYRELQEQRAQEQARDKRNKMWSAIGKGISSIAGAVATNAYGSGNANETKYDPVAQAEKEEAQNTATYQATLEAWRKNNADKISALQKRGESAMTGYQGAVNAKTKWMTQEKADKRKQEELDQNRYIADRTYQQKDDQFKQQQATTKNGQRITEEHLKRSDANSASANAENARYHAGQLSLGRQRNAISASKGNKPVKIGQVTTKGTDNLGNDVYTTTYTYGK